MMAGRIEDEKSAGYLGRKIGQKKTNEYYRRPKVVGRKETKELQPKGKGGKQSEATDGGRKIIKNYTLRREKKENERKQRMKKEGMKSTA